MVVPATELEAQGHSIIKLNIGDPIAYPGLPTPSHMVDAFVRSTPFELDEMVILHPMDYQSYGLQSLDERTKGWPADPEDVYVCHGVTEALQILFQATLDRRHQVLAPAHIILHTWLILKCTVLKQSNID